jgi:hypothetical protein
MKPPSEPLKPNEPLPKPNVGRDDEGPLADDEPFDSGPEPSLAAYQIGLRGLFALVLACGVYFALERILHGQFAIGSLAMAAILIGLGLPIFWIAISFLKLVMDAREPFGTVLLVIGIAAAVLLALTLLRGF